MKRLYQALPLLALLAFASCQEDEEPCDPLKEQALAQREAELDRREAELLARERAIGVQNDGVGTGTNTQQISSGDGRTAKAAVRTTGRYSGKNRYANPSEDGRTVAYRKARFFPGQFPEASERVLTAADLEHETAWGKKVMLNEIYARHGLTFTEPDLRRHFNAESWYKGGKSNVDNLLTAIEKQNIVFIKQNM